MFVLPNSCQSLLGFLTLIPILLIAGCGNNTQSETRAQNEGSKIKVVPNDAKAIEPIIHSTQSTSTSADENATTKLNAPLIPVPTNSGKRLENHQTTSTKAPREERLDALSKRESKTNEPTFDVATTTAPMQPTAQETDEPISQCTERNRGARQIRALNMERMFPASAIEQGMEGRVNVALQIDANGNVVETTIISSSHPEIFDAPVIRETTLMKFSPARRDCVDVAATYNLTIQFHLEKVGGKH